MQFRSVSMYVFTLIVFCVHKFIDAWNVKRDKKVNKIFEPKGVLCFRFEQTKKLYGKKGKEKRMQ